MTNSHSNTTSPAKPGQGQGQQGQGQGQLNGTGNPLDPFKIGLIQLNTQEDIQWNIQHCSELIRKAVADGASLIITPENTGRMSAQFRYNDTCGDSSMFVTALFFGIMIIHS
jgi:hypothetical protein